MHGAQRVAISRRTKERCPILSQSFRLKAICTSILNYADDKSGALDPKVRAELQAILARLDALAAALQSAREGKAAAHGEAVKAVGRLKQEILRARRALELAAVGRSAAPSLPATGKGIFLASRIHGVAVGHVQALAAAGSDPIFGKTAAAITDALAGFVKADAASKARRIGLAGLTGTLEEELAAITQKLVAYKALAASNVPRPDRKDLRNRIRAVVRTAAHRRKDEGETAVAPAADPATATATLPLLPTVIPPLSEHPAIPTVCTELRRDGVTSPPPSS